MDGFDPFFSSTCILTSGTMRLKAAPGLSPGADRFVLLREDPTNDSIFVPTVR